MAAYGWNSPYTNVHNEHSRPYGSRQTMLACRICDKIFLGAQSLIGHYESHEDELAQQRQNHHGTYSLPYNRDINLGNNPFHHRTSPSPASQQRHHPYFPNGYRTLQQQARERNPVANANSPFLVSTQNPQLYQTRNNPVGNNSTVPGSSSFPISMTGSSAVRTNQSMTNLQLGPAMSSKYATLTPLGSDQKPTCSLRVEDQKGYDESGDKRTIWYLSQLEQPIPAIIDLESHDESHEHFKLNLRR